MFKLMPGRRLRLLFISAVILGGIALILAACGGGEEEGPSATTRAAGTPAAGATAVEIKAIPVNKFDKNKLTIAADKNVTIAFDNTDNTVIHNFAIYKSKADADSGKAALFKMELCTGPCKETLEVKLDKGEYYFKCDVHPAEMNGTIIAQ